jgi:hypothetical protein
MTLRSVTLGVSLLLMTCWHCLATPRSSADGSIPAAVAPQTPPIRTTTSLVMIDVLVEDKKTGEPVKDLEKDDFVVRDNGKAVAITTFNSGKDQNLRPIQLWFVLVCNEEVHYQVGGRRRTQIEATEKRGAGFMAGKASELLGPGLQHLEANETVGVAHWCDNGESEIDMTPTVDRAAPLKAIDELAARKGVVIEQMNNESSQEHVMRLIDDVARSAFPIPVTAIVFVGGKESGRLGNPGDSSSGSMEFSSMEFGLGNGGDSGGAGDSSNYKVQNNQYGNRLGTIIDILRNRYEVGFLPGKPGKKLHRVEMVITKEAKERYASALVIRYRDAYRDKEQVRSSDEAKQMATLKQLDSRMQMAVKSAGNQGEVSFEVREIREAQGAAVGTQRFSLRIDPKALTWRMLPNGDRRSVVTTVVACYSQKGQPIGVVVKELEIIEESDRLQAMKNKPVVITVSAMLAKGATRIRMVVRDVASGHIGSQDLQPLAGNSLGENAGNLPV